MSTRTGISPLLVESQSLVDRVTHAIRAAILEGRLRPGEGLSISDLSSDLGVSPSPVREALQRLAGQELVVLRPARSAIVAPLSIDDLQEIYRLRRVLEVDVAARSAPALTDGDLEHLADEFALLAGAVIDSESFWEHHAAFHGALMAPAMTPRVQRLITELAHAAERYIRVVYGETDVLFARTPADRHRPLLEAARTGKSAAVRKALTEHLTANEQEIVRSLESMLAPGSTR